MLKIATILPYKENYSKTKAAAASLWVYDFFKHSNLKARKFLSFSKFLQLDDQQIMQ